MQCGAGQNCAVQYSTVNCEMVFGAVHCVVQCSEVRYGAVHLGAVQCSVLYCIHLPPEV